jgi:hypothetical protein
LFKGPTKQCDIHKADPKGALFPNCFVGVKRFPGGIP